MSSRPASAERPVKKVLLGQRTCCDRLSDINWDYVHYCVRWQGCKKLCYRSTFNYVHLKFLGSLSALDIFARVCIEDQENWSVEQWNHGVSAPLGMHSPHSIFVTFLASSSFLMYIQRSPLFCASIFKKDPGRARQNSLATAGTNFTKPGVHNKGDLCMSL